MNFKDTKETVHNRGHKPTNARQKRFVRGLHVDFEGSEDRFEVFSRSTNKGYKYIIYKSISFRDSL